MKMCQAMAQQGHEVRLVARAGEVSDQDDFESYGVDRCFALVKCRVRRPVFGAEILYARAASATIGKLQWPELVYGRHLLSLAAVVGRGAPLIYEAHTPPLGWDKMVQRWLFRRPNFVRLVVISQALSDAFCHLYTWLSPETIMVAHDAADEPAEHPVQTFSRGDGRLQVGYVGQLYAGKGAEMVIALAARMPQVDFHIVGGTDHDIRQWKIRSRRLPNLVFHGFVAPRDTDSYRQAMDILIAPYQEKVAVSGGQGDVASWMSPLKIFEYMAAGKAMVVSDLSVLKEILRDGVEALLVKPDDVEGWEHAIVRLADPVLRNQLGRSAEETFRMYHTWPQRARKVLRGF